MAVAFDAKTVAVKNVSGVATLDVTDLTVGSGSNRALLVMLWLGSGSPVSGITVTWDQGGTNQSCTAITNAAGINNPSASNISMYGLIAPTSGNKTLRISWTGNLEAHAMAMSFTGVDQTSVAVAFPNGAFLSQTTGSNTVTVTSAVGNMVAAMHSQNSSGWSAISDTTLNSDDVTGPNLATAGNYANGAASKVMTATFSGGQHASAGTDVLAAGGGAAVVVGWWPRIDGFMPKPPMRFQPPPAIALIPSTLPPVVSGMAWFEPPDRNKPATKVTVESLPAFTLSPPALLSQIQGMGWFNPPDRNRPATKINGEAPRAIALIPATLPPQIAGMAWFEPPDRLQPRRSIAQDAPAYAPLVVTAVEVAAVYGWWPSVSDFVRRRPILETDPAFAFAPVPTPIIWTQAAPELQPRAPINRVAPAPPFVPPPAAAPIIWTQAFPEPPLRARAAFAVAPAFAFAPPAAPTQIDGMGWYSPPEMVPKRTSTASWNSSAAWVSQEYTSVIPTVDELPHALPFLGSMGRMTAR